MFKYFDNYKKIISETKDISHKYKQANNEKKSLIKWLVIIGIGISLFVALFQIFMPVNEVVEYDRKEIIYEEVIDEQILDVVDIPQEKYGRGQEIPNPIDALNPFSSFQESIVDAISEIVLQGIELFDDYVSFTPNVAKNDGQIVDARGEVITLNLDKYYRITNSIAWMLLPIIIVIVGSNIVLNSKFRGMQLLMETARKVFIFVIALVSIRYIFLLSINIINLLNILVLQNLIPGGSTTLSESLVTAFGMTITDGGLEFTLGEALNIFGEIILWVGLFILLITILFQFIIRFFHLILHFIMFPIILMIGLLPSGGKILSSYIEEIVRTLIVQPVFLIGLALSIEIITGIDEPIPKIVLGLGSLAFLNIIPLIVSRFTGILWGVGGAFVGGAITFGTINQLEKVKQGFIAGASGGRGSSVRSAGGKILGEKFRSAFVKDENNSNKQYQNSNTRNSRQGSSNQGNESYSSNTKQQSEPKSKGLQTVKRAEANNLNTFDSGNKSQWNDLSSWYSEKQSGVDGKSQTYHRNFANNPNNRSKVINKAVDDGYFDNSEYEAVKVNKQVTNKQSSQKRGRTQYFKIIKNERNSTTKTK